MRQEAVSFDELSHRELLKIDPTWWWGLVIVVATYMIENPPNGG
jgi:hypothetical protein